MQRTQSDAMSECNPHERMERSKAGEEDEIVEQRQRDTAAPTKRTKRADDADDASGAGMCDDVVGNILARVPARTAVACMALSKHHRRLIRSPEFRSLHCRLAPPLPRPHVAYVVTAPIKRPDEGAVGRFHGFHVAAGAGISGGAPMRALAGSKYLDMAYVNTCNGVVLLGVKKFSASCRCTLWNPAVADDGVKEVAVPSSEKSKCLVLGLGYGGRSSSKTYKLLLCHKDLRLRHSRFSGKSKCHDHQDCRVNHSLLLYDLGDTDKELRLQTSISAEPYFEISTTSLYIAGTSTLYLLHFDKSVILAFNMDDETFSTINLPPPAGSDPRYWFAAPVLMEVSGHMCVVTNECGHRKALWFLTLDHKWEQKYLIGKARDDIGNREERAFYHSLALGVWDCHGVLVLYLQHGSGTDKLCLYHVDTKKMFMANLPSDLAPSSSGYEWSWGYRPTLVSPGCIVGKFNQDSKERHRDRSSDITLALKPINEQDKKKGRKATLNTVCFMELLVRIMQKLPDDMQDVLEMPLMDSEDPIFFSVDALYSSG